MDAMAELEAGVSSERLDKLERALEHMTQIMLVQQKRTREPSEEEEEASSETSEPSAPLSTKSTGMPCHLQLERDEIGYVTAKEHELLEWILAMIDGEKWDAARVVGILRARADYLEVSRKLTARGVKDAFEKAKRIFSPTCLRSKKYLASVVKDVAATVSMDSAGAAAAAAAGSFATASATQRTPRDTCMNCGEKGHWSRDCPYPHIPKGARSASGGRMQAAPMYQYPVGYTQLPMVPMPGAYGYQAPAWGPPAIPMWPQGGARGQTQEAVERGPIQERMQGGAGPMNADGPAAVHQ